MHQCFICCPSDYTVSEDAEIEPRTDVNKPMHAALKLWKMGVIAKQQKLVLI
jgi:hypothetical protein